MSPEGSTESAEQPQPKPLAQDSIVAKAALVALVVTIVASAFPLYGLHGQVLNIVRNLPTATAIATLVLGMIFSAAMPAFFWVLYRGAATLRFRDEFRLPALFIAILAAFLILWSSGVWVFRALENSDSTVLAATPSPFNFSNLLTLAVSLSSLVTAGVLYALYRRPNLELIEPPYKPLRIISAVCVVIATLYLGFLAIRVSFFWYVYPTIRAEAIRNGYGAPTLIGLMADGLHTLIEQACAWAAPILVWLSLRSKPAAPAGLATPLEEQPSEADASEDTEHPPAAAAL